MKNNEQIERLWDKRITEYNKSDMTQRDWCRINGITVNQLKYWISKQVKPGESASSSINASGFIPVDVSEEISIPKNNKLILKIANVSIEIEPGYNKELLSDLLSTLKSIC